MRDLEDASAKRGWQLAQGYADHFGATDPHQFARPALERLLSDASQGAFTVVLVPRLSSLADTLPACLDVLRRFIALGLGVVTLEDGLDSTRAGSDLAALVAALSRLEAHAASIAKDRVRAGLRRARAAGTRLGRPPMTQWTRDRIVESWQHTGSMRRTGLELKLPYSSVHAVVTAHRQAHPTQRSIRLELWLRVENNSKWVRGKARTLREIERGLFWRFDAKQPNPHRGVYHLTLTYSSDEDLERQIDELLREMHFTAELRNGFVEADLTEIGGGERRWS